MERERERGGREQSDVERFGWQRDVDSKRVIEMSTAFWGEVYPNYLFILVVFNNVALILAYLVK